MKRVSLLILGVLLVFSLSSNVFASNDDAFYINKAYFKGDGEYDIVVYSSNKDTLKIYINDDKSVKAKVNKEGWATFKKVKLSGQSKLSFAKKVGFSKYYPVNYVNYISVDNEKVKLTGTGPKHSFEDFYNWSTAERYDAITTPVGSAYQQIMASCGSRDRSFGSVWTSCMQEGYKDYLKPDTFIDGNWQGYYTIMVGHINNAGSLKNWYGDLSISESEEYKMAMQEAQKLYERMAVTN